MNTYIVDYINNTSYIDLLKTINCFNFTKVELEEMLKEYNNFYLTNLITLDVEDRIELLKIVISNYEIEALKKIELNKVFSNFNIKINEKEMIKCF